MPKGRDKKIASRRKKDESVMMISTPKIGGAWRLWVLGFILLLMLAGTIYLLFFSDYFKIKEVAVEGAQDTMEVDIKEMVSWETDYMILFDEDGFAEDILGRWEELARVEVEKDWPNNLNIYLFLV